MIRIVVENLLLFLLPTIIYVAWVMLTRDEAANPQPGGRGQATRVLDDAPLLWLFAAGTVLVIVTLVMFGSTSGGKPGQHYQPPVMKDGRIEPGHIE